jgi:hypothetical protein
MKRLVEGGRRYDRGLNFCVHTFSVYTKRAFSLSSFDIVKYAFTFTIKVYILREYMGFVEHVPGKAGDPKTR